MVIGDPMQSAPLAWWAEGGCSAAVAAYFDEYVDFPLILSENFHGLENQMLQKLLENYELNRLGERVFSGTDEFLVPLNYFISQSIA